MTIGLDAIGKAVTTILALAVVCVTTSCDQRKSGGAQTAESHKNVLILTEANFENEVLKASQPVLVDFWATWCGPCKVIAPVVAELSDEFQGKAKVGKVDVDAQPDLAKKYNISAIPTLMIFKDGKPVDQLVGAQGKAELKARLQKVTGSAAPESVPATR